MSATLSQELAWRGFTFQHTLEPKGLDGDKLTFYWGVDPSADSMTIGNLAAAMMVRHFIEHGHRAVLLIGGATGIIGDPDGKARERELLTPEELEHNKKAISSQYKTIFAGQDFDIVDNADWFKSINYIEFLRDVGKHVPMRQMLNREFVQSRLGEDNSGISYAEFSYSLIQGYDFLHLYRTKGVTLQVCGSDQWGNSIAGVDLIRRVEGKEAHIWSCPLIVNKTTGAKFGKSEDGAIWLDKNKTSAFDFYQFWLNADDEGAEDYLKVYTLLDKKEIETVMDEFKQNPGARKAQKTLAREVTALVHGKDEAASIERINGCLFGESNYFELTSKDIATMKDILPVHRAKAGENLNAALVSTGLVGSNSEARRMFEQNAVSLNGRLAEDGYLLKSTDSVASGHAILKKGKNKYALIELG